MLSSEEQPGKTRPKQAAFKGEEGFPARACTHRRKSSAQGADAPPLPTPSTAPGPARSSARAAAIEDGPLNVPTHPKRLSSGIIDQPSVEGGSSARVEAIEAIDGAYAGGLSSW
ncbi:hypothetical protein MRX96_002441 [Rhipicephalus microplus]